MEKYIKFRNGSKVCRLGQGTWMMGRNKSKRKEEITALQHGIELGMNLIDTAELYENEELVGEAIKGYCDRVFIVRLCLQMLITKERKERVNKACVD